MSERGAGPPMGRGNWRAIRARSGFTDDGSDRVTDPPSTAEARPAARPGWGGAGQRTFTEILTLVVASAVVALGTAVVGMMLTAPAAPKDAPADLLSGTCLDEPFRPANGVLVGTLARLCFDIDAVRPRVELTGVTNGALYTGWISKPAVPAGGRGNACDLSDAGASGTMMPPERFDATIADQTGRVQLSTNLPGLKIPGGSEVRLLVVDHGWAGPDQTPLRVAQLSVWDGAWVRGTATTGGDRARGHLVGCASFWLRGGVETLEQ